MSTHLIEILPGISVTPDTAIRLSAHGPDSGCTSGNIPARVVLIIGTQHYVHHLTDSATLDDARAYVSERTQFWNSEILKYPSFPDFNLTALED